MSFRKLKLALLAASRSAGLFRLAGWMNRKNLCILCYHGFAIDGENGFSPRLFMDREVFAQRLERLRRTERHVLPLAEALQALYSKTLPRNAVVITIDDGFYSTCRQAAPLLHAFGYPATVYVTTYYAGKDMPIFRLFVRYAFWKTRARRLVESEVIPELQGVVNLSDREAAARSMERINACGQGLSPESQVCIAEKLGQALGVPYAAVAANRSLSLMTPEEIRSLEEYGLDVQLHTHRHQLPTSREATLKEIRDNRRVLEPLMDRSLRHFCYPSGIWSSEHWPWLAEAEIESATTCDYGMNNSSTHRLALMRFVDGEDVTPVEFDAAVCGFTQWVDALRSVASRVLRTLRPGQGDRRGSPEAAGARVSTAPPVRDSLSTVSRTGTAHE